MKYLVSIILLFLTVGNSSARNLDSLNQKMIGTWELKTYLSTNNSTGNEGPDKIKRTKVMNATHYTTTYYDIKTGTIGANITGNYGLSDTSFGVNNCQETAISVTRGIESLLNKRFQKTVSIDEGDRLIYTWTSNDVKYTEIWSRITKKPIVTSQPLDSLLQQQMIGTWDLIKFDYGNGKAADPSKYNFRRLKLYNSSNYTVTDIDVNTYITKTAFLGNFFTGKDPSIKGNYQEDKLPVTSSIPKHQEDRFVCNVFIDAEDQLHFEWMSDGAKCSEVWMRIGDPGPDDALRTGLEKLRQQKNLE